MDTYLILLMMLMFLISTTIFVFKNELKKYDTDIDDIDFRQKAMAQYFNQS